jgi:hypothetical protein
MLLGRRSEVAKQLLSSRLGEDERGYLEEYYNHLNLEICRLLGLPDESLAHPK